MNDNDLSIDERPARHSDQSQISQKTWFGLDEEPVFQTGEVNKTLEDMQDKIERVGKDLIDLVKNKNKSYGNSFLLCEHFLTLLYPMGVSTDQYTNILLFIRIFDKMVRGAKGHMDDVWDDLAGYGLLGLTNSK